MELESAVQTLKSGKGHAAPEAASEAALHQQHQHQPPAQQRQQQQQQPAQQQPITNHTLASLNMYQPSGSKQYLSFNEKLFPGGRTDGSVKQGAAPTLKSEAQVQPGIDARRAQSSSPVSSEESAGVPLKKRKVLVL